MIPQIIVTKTWVPSRLADIARRLVREMKAIGFAKFNMAMDIETSNLTTSWLPATDDSARVAFVPFLLNLVAWFLDCKPAEVSDARVDSRKHMMRVAEFNSWEDRYVAACGLLHLVACRDEEGGVVCRQFVFDPFRMDYIAFGYHDVMVELPLRYNEQQAIEASSERGGECSFFSSFLNFAYAYPAPMFVVRKMNAMLRIGGLPALLRHIPDLLRLDLFSTEEVTFFLASLTLDTSASGQLVISPTTIDVLFPHFRFSLCYFRNTIDWLRGAFRDALKDVLQLLGTKIDDLQLPKALLYGKALVDHQLHIEKIRAACRSVSTFLEQFDEKLAAVETLANTANRKRGFDAAEPVYQNPPKVFAHGQDAGGKI